MRPFRFTVALFGLLAGLACAETAVAQSNPGEAGPSDDPFAQAVFFFGGRLQSSYFPSGFNPFTATYEDNYVAGGGYQYRLWSPFPTVSIGAEVGLAARFGTGTSAELWTGIYFRQDGLVIGDTVRITPSITLGLSAVTGLIGTEASRAAMSGDSAILHFYMGPELSISLVEHPQTELFWRYHHRSGGYGLLSHVDGSNATIVGVRQRF